MSRARWLAPVIAVLAVVTVVTVAAVRSRRPGEPAPRAAVSAAAVLEPRVALFGAPVHAELRISVDPARVNPRKVRATAQFAPYAPLGAPRITRHSAGRSTVIRIAYRLQCVAASCSRPGGQAMVALRPAVVRWGAHRLAVGWPPAAIASRLTAGDVSHPSLRYTTEVPARSYRVDPVAVGWTSIGAAAAIVLALGALVPLRLRHAPVPVETPSSDLERALERVVETAEGTESDRRGAIGELAQVLERDGFGELAPLARRIAWASGGPSPDVATELALLVRAAVEVAA
ncbi:MAG: hypothetical protein ACJ77E_18230 [Gaiellaceae bacterium]